MAVKSLSHLNNENGFASIESLAMLFILASLVSYSFGSFGAIHTGILHSISARAYLWEILDARPNPIYLRSNVAIETTAQFADLGFRASGITSRHITNGVAEHRSSGRNIDIRKRSIADTGDTEEKHNRVYQMDLGKRVDIDVQNVWVKSQYGICMDVNCGGLE